MMLLIDETKKSSFFFFLLGIFSSSIKQNILFGADFNSDLFVNVLRVTALDEDLLHFPDGVNTLVGDHGVMLSGVRLYCFHSIIRH